MLAVRRMPPIESVADERIASLTVGTDRGTGKNVDGKLRDVHLDVGAEVGYNGHVVEPDAKDPAGKRVFAPGFSFHPARCLRA